MKRFVEQQEAVDRAVEELAKAINREFPVGARVSAPTGKGRYLGVVASETWDDRVRVRSDRGRSVHHVHYNDVDHA